MYSNSQIWMGILNTHPNKSVCNPCQRWDDHDHPKTATGEALLYFDHVHLQEVRGDARVMGFLRMPQMHQMAVITRPF